jgi:hypothetical protein
LSTAGLLDVDGHDAFLLESHGHLAGKDLHFLALYVIEKDRVIQVTCTAPADKYEMASSQFKAALGSVKIGK